MLLRIDMNWAIGVFSLALMILLMWTLPKSSCEGIRFHFKRIPTFLFYLLGSQTFQSSKGHRSKFLVKKTIKHTFFSLFAGMLFITTAGLYLGRVLSMAQCWWNMIPPIFWIVTTVLAVIFLVLKIWLYRKSLKLPPVDLLRDRRPLGLVVLLTLLCFFAGFILAGYGWHTLGLYPLSQAWKDVEASELWPNPLPQWPYVPDSENALYYLQKAQEAVPANSPFITHNLAENQNINNFQNDLMGGKITPEQMTRMKNLLKGHQETFRWVDKAFGKKVDWNIETRPPTSKTGAIKVDVRTFERLLGIQAYLESKEGFAPKAVHRLAELLFLGDVARLENGAWVDHELFLSALNIFKLISPGVNLNLAEKGFFPFFKVKERTIDYRKEPPGVLFNGKMSLDFKGWVEFIQFQNHAPYGYYINGNGPLTRYLGALFYWPFFPFDETSQHEHDLRMLKAYQLTFGEMVQACRAETAQFESQKWLLDYQYPPNDEIQYFSRVTEMTAYAHLAQAAFAARRFHIQNKRWPTTMGDLSGNPTDYSDPFNHGAPLLIERYQRGIVIYCLTSLSELQELNCYGGARLKLSKSNVSSSLAWVVE